MVRKGREGRGEKRVWVRGERRGEKRTCPFVSSVTHQSPGLVAAVWLYCPFLKSCPADHEVGSHVDAPDVYAIEAIARSAESVVFMVEKISWVDFRFGRSTEA